jgi:hypothetical protein
MVSGAPSARYGWSLCGLAESLRRQNKAKGEIAATRRPFCKFATYLSDF